MTESAVIIVEYMGCNNDDYTGISSYMYVIFDDHDDWQYHH